MRVRAGTSHGASTSLLVPRVALAIDAALAFSADGRSMSLIAFHALRQPNVASAPPASRSTGEIPAVAPPLISSSNPEAKMLAPTKPTPDQNPLRVIARPASLDRPGA